METSPYVPVVFCHTSGLQMEPPADAAGSGVASQKETPVGLPRRERNALGLAEEEESGGVMKVRTNVRYKKPKAKGPNPLACKKKIVKERKGAAAPGWRRRRRGWCGEKERRGISTGGPRHRGGAAAAEEEDEEGTHAYCTVLLCNNNRYCYHTNEVLCILCRATLSQNNMPKQDGLMGDI